MVQVVYQTCQDATGMKECKTVKPSVGPSRRPCQITELRKELRLLKERWQKSVDEEKTALNQLHSVLRKNILQLRRVETIHKK